MPWGKQNYQRFFPTLTYQCDPRIAAVLREVPAGGRVVDLGAGGRKISPQTICVDYLLTDNTDLRADVQALPLRSASVDLIVATGLFEHVEDIARLCAEIARVVKPGGVVHVEMPFLQQYHEDPIDCRRYTVPDLERVMDRFGFDTIEKGVHIGPTVTVITLWTYWAAMVFEGRSKFFKALSTLVFLFFSIVLWPLKFLDRWLVRKPSASRLAFGIYFTGRRRVAGA